jgi:hypothetical protein
VKKEEVEAQIAERRADHLTNGPLSRACFDARCDDCGLDTCTCGCHHPHCPRCGSRAVELVWARMYTWDTDSWACHTCNKRWTA